MVNDHSLLPTVHRVESAEENRKRNRKEFKTTPNSYDSTSKNYVPFIPINISKFLGLQCNSPCPNWWRTDRDRILEEEKCTLSCISSSIHHIVFPNYTPDLRRLSRVLQTFFFIFFRALWDARLWLMTQIPTARKYNKLVKGATSSDVYSFALLKFHCTRINGAFPMSILYLHEAMYSLRSCYIVTISKSGK